MRDRGYLLRIGALESSVICRGSKFLRQGGLAFLRGELLRDGMGLVDENN